LIPVIFGLGGAISTPQTVVLLAPTFKIGFLFAKSAMSMVYNSKMKEAIKAGGCNTAGDASGALNAAVEAAVATAVARCGANGRKTIRAHDIGGGSSSSGMVVASRVKEAFKSHGCNTGGDAMGAMNALAAAAVDGAVSRAKANGRKTVRASDF
tara:strand:+ start:9530 stop:9991 length:462 start_codon:yes stop_codon:yes gene_type:complete